jgi:hypothetical protein
MSESVAAVQIPSYRDLIKEVFIDPIRTVVVVDDEYPTLDTLLMDSQQSRPQENEKITLQTSNENYQKVREILKFCRNRQPTPWLVDIHDGKTPPIAVEGESVSHFDHSDLLILDYHLESTQGSDKAIEILRRLAGNSNFNLVVVYTQDRDEVGAGIDRTIIEIALSLASPVKKFELHARKLANLQQRMESWEDLQEGIFNHLLGCVDEAAFLKILEREDRHWDALSQLPELSALSLYLSSIPEDV